MDLPRANFGEIGVVRLILQYALPATKIVAQACKSCDKSVIPWMEKTYAIKNYDETIKASADQLLAKVCGSGPKNALDWFLEHYGAAVTHCGRYAGMHEAATRGRVSVITTLTLTYKGFEPSLGTLEAMCSGGRLREAKQLVQSMDYKQFRRERVRCQSVIDMISRVFEAHRRERTAEWLADLFGYTFEGLVDDERFWRVLHVLCRRGRTKKLRRAFGQWGRVAQWNHPRQLSVGMTLIRVALSMNQMKVVKCLSAAFRFSAEDFSKNYLTMHGPTGPSLLVTAHDLGKHDFVKWVSQASGAEH